MRRFASSGRGKDNCLEANIEDNQWLLKEIHNLRKGYKNIMHITTGDPLYVLVDERKEEYLGKKLLGGCTAGIISLAIDAHGNIKPCTRADINLGNVRNVQLSKVWEQNDILQKLRNRELYEGKCGQCPYKMFCGGCRVTALYEDDSILGTDTKCWI